MNEDEVFENHYFIINKKLLKTMYIWPYQKRSLKLFVRTFVIVFIHTLMIPQMIKTYYEFHEENMNVEIISENLAGFFYFQAVLSKIGMSIYSEKKLQHLYEHVTKDYKEIQDPEERAPLVEVWSFARFLSIICISYMFIACLCFVFLPVVTPAILDVIVPLNESRTKMICYYAEYFIDQQKYLYYLVVHTFIGIAFTLLIVAAVDTSFFAVACHALGLFNLLRGRLRKLCKQVNSGDYREEELHNFMVDTIKIHKKIIDFADIVKITYNEGFFFVTGMVLAALSIGTIDVIMNLNNPANLIRTGSLFLGIIGYMFFTNWPGQKFLDSSEELLESAYFCNWYKLPLKTQFLVKFMMMRCANPCQLTAGPLLQMNFANCGLVFRTAFSYFTAVASLG